jgi:hypothetical protein
MTNKYLTTQALEWFDGIRQRLPALTLNINFKAIIIGWPCAAATINFNG